MPSFDPAKRPRGTSVRVSFDDGDNIEMDELAHSWRVLGDAARLRLIRILCRAELAAGEAAQVVGLAPSTLSKHVAILRDAGFLAERRDGRHAYYAIPVAVRHDPRWETALDRICEEPDSTGDLARLDDVLRARRESDQRDATSRPFVPGRSWAAWARALSLLVPPGLRVADLGCGDGALALEVARFAAAVVGVDRRAPLIRQARKRATARGVKHVRFETGDFEHPSLRRAAFDVVLFSQSLHATEDPAAALASAARLLAPGGRVLILDLYPHTESWVTERLGHRRLGFAPKKLGALLSAAGFTKIRVEKGAGRAGEPFKVLLATATLRS